MSQELPIDPLEFGGILVLIPTRNRAELAVRAIRSVLQATPRDLVAVVVSDNSTEPSQLSALETFCREHPDSRVHYMRPPEPLKMADHWNWAIGQSLERYPASHLTVLPDRRIFVQGGIADLARVARDNPDKAILGEVDIVFDYSKPIRVYAKQGSGRVIEVSSRTMINANSRSVLRMLTLVPTPMISVIPRRVFSRVLERFGDYCLSLAPDFCFGYRLLDIEESILILDQSTTVMLNMDRSTGYALMRGSETKDKTDFIATNSKEGTEFTYWATPAPQLVTGLNGMVHEYNVVRSQTSSGRFPELELQPYLEMLHGEIIAHFDNPELKERYLTILNDHGFRAQDTDPDVISPREAEQPTSRRSIPRRIVDKLYWTAMKGIWKARQIPPIRFLSWRFCHLFNIKFPQWIADQGFDSVEEALEYLQRMKVNPSDSIEKLVERESQLRA